MKKLPNLEVLARELESLGKPGLQELVANVRDNEFRRDILIRDLQKLKLNFFAKKLASGFYDAQLHVVFSDKGENDIENISETTPEN